MAKPIFGSTICYSNFDCLVVKVRQDKRIINKSVYAALGIDLSGRKDILGLWISENEGAKFWLGNFTEMKNRLYARHTYCLQ